jgi:TonB family protein
MLDPCVIHDTTRLNCGGAQPASTEHTTDPQEQITMTGQTAVNLMGFGALRAAARSVTILGLLLVGALIPVAHAQLVPSVTASPPAGAASTTSGLERAQRQVDNVYKWIKLADKPKPAAPTPATAPAPAARPAAPKPAVVQAPTPQAVPAAAAASLAPPEVIAPQVVAAPAPEPTPVVAPPPVQVAKAAEPVVEEETPLRIISQEQPTVPRDLRNDLENAKVTMAFLVGIDGKVTNARAINSTNRKLERPTIAAVSNWVFAPVKTPREVQVEIEFNVK